MIIIVLIRTVDIELSLNSLTLELSPKENNISMPFSYFIVHL